jgi:hypothetical protein
MCLIFVGTTCRRWWQRNITIWRLTVAEMCQAKLSRATFQRKVHHEQLESWFQERGDENIHVKLSLKTELASFPLNPAKPPLPPPRKVYLPVNFNQGSSQELEDYLNSLANGRRPKFWKMEDNLIFLENGSRPKFFRKWKTTSSFRENERQLHFFGKMEDNLNFKVNWR